MLEWKEYCDYKYGGDAKVTPDKVFTFLFYQAYREKKPSGGKYGNACSTGVNKRRKMTKSLKGYKKFNEHDFENVLASNKDDSNYAVGEIPDKDYCDFSNYKQYHMAIVNELKSVSN